MASGDGALFLVAAVLAAAILGNLIVLVVFNWRWRATGATKIYILTLAGLDLLCSLVSLPREIIFQQGVREIRVFCSVTVFLIYFFNCASAIVLVIIAASRFFKVIPIPFGLNRKAFGKFSRLIRTVRGAKIACTSALGFAMLCTFPVAIFFTRADFRKVGGESGFRSCFESLNSTTESEKSQRTMHFGHLALFLVLVSVLVFLYGAILRQQWEDRKDEKVAEKARRQSSVFFSTSSASLGSLCEPRNTPEAKQAALRTKSESDAPKSLNTRRSINIPAEFSRTVSSPFPQREMNLLRINTRSRMESDRSDMPENETNRLTYFPPIAYSAQLRSLISLDMARSQSIDESEGVNLSLKRKESLSSMRFKKGGNRQRQTTLVFVVITFIYIVSFLPYFWVALQRSFDPKAGDTASEFSRILLKSYLLSNAANPLVYGFCNPHFRNALWKIIVCRREIL